ncbi:MAG TPA: hypothetical protein VKX49_32515 [Bryobacteraceae bacterium]|nr:hypothetical protein [Bryobacteraceae bacterium]
MREISWESRAFCSHRRWAFVVPAATLCAAVWLLFSGQSNLGGVLLLAALGFALLFASPFLPIYTPGRARTFRVVRWAWLAAILLLAFSPDIWKQSWLFAGCAWPIVWVEWRLSSLRRKLPRGEWPKMLYL